MDKLEMCRMLPTAPPAELVSYAYKNHFSQLGNNITVYKRVNITQAPEISRTMTPEDWDEYYKARRNTWAAECTCSACEDTWNTGWLGGPLKSIMILSGEDGWTYPYFNTDQSDPQDVVIPVNGNDSFSCPICGVNTTLTHVEKVRGGFTRRLLIMNVGNVGKYTTIFYWLLRRQLDVDGIDYRSVEPWNAYVLDEKGKISRFCYSSYDGWRASSTTNDAFYSKYASGDGDIYNYRYGGRVWSSVPSQLGCTGEKTGLAEYVRKGGLMPLLYLKTWRKKPAIESLVNAGWAKLVSEMLCEESGHEIKEGQLEGIDWTKNRPHEMLGLGLDKPQFKALCTNSPDGWDMDEFNAWHRYHAGGGKANAVDFGLYWTQFTKQGITAAIEAMGVYNVDLPQIDRYLSKQKLERAECRQLTDTWRMTAMLYGRTELTHEEMWPRDLIARHDQLSDMNLKELGKDGWAVYLAGFKLIQEKYGGLQWTDGDLCIRLPANNGDLIREGEVLRHCV